MLYSALNLRGSLQQGPDVGDWYHIAIGHYNIILPSFLPSTISTEQAFWHCAGLVRKQTSDVVKSRWMKPRAMLMALERERRAQGFEREDERRRVAKGEKDLAQGLMGLGIAFSGETPKGVETESEEASKPAPEPKVEEKKPAAAPSTALMGLSMLGSMCCPSLLLATPC